VFHDPRGLRSGVPVSIQIGDPVAVARAAGCPVVSNFRMADVLEGGEGAPLVPLFDWHQFGSNDGDIALVNLGGIANLTRLRPGEPLEGITAFDCGPGNMLLDGIMQQLARARYDAEGALAATGRASEDVVREFLADEFIGRLPPKSAGREEFGADYLVRFLTRTEGFALPDRLRTAVAITAGAVARGLALTGEPLPEAVYVSGGGARNATLMAAIEALLLGTAVATTDALGVPAAAKEAMAFAFLALETLAGRPGNVPAATGARRAVVLGTVTPPPAQEGPA
jgi:anhydro-N-acetylmuramic acid kinase